MTILNLEARLRKLEAARASSDRSIRELSDQQLASALRAASDDPADHAMAAWFLGEADISTETIATFMGGIGQ